MEITLEKDFEIVRKILLDMIDGKLYTQYGQFPEFDELIDDFRQRVARVELDFSLA